MNGQQTINAPGALELNEKDFCNGVMPRAQLSKAASEIAVEKATNKNAKEFAGFELMEATTVVKLLEDIGTDAPPLNEDAKAFISKLKASSGGDFDKFYMEAELSNHEFLRDLASNYLDSAEERNSSDENEIKSIATLALYAFKEHVALSKRIYGEVS